MFYLMNLRIRKVGRKHSLRGDNSSFGLIEVAHQWKWKMPLHWRPLAHKRNAIFKCKQHTYMQSNPRDQKNKTTQWYSTGRHFTVANKALNISNSSSIILRKGKILCKAEMHIYQYNEVIFFFNSHSKLNCLHKC